MQYEKTSIQGATGLPTPQVSGTTETYQLEGLAAGVTYYIGIEAIDDAVNVSALSNIVTATCPEIHPPITLILPDAQTAECDSVVIPLTVQNSTDVYGLEIRIEYDTLQVEFDTLLSDQFVGEYSYDTLGVVRPIWADTNPISLDDNDTLLYLHYSNLSGTSPLTFDETTHVMGASYAHRTLELTDGSMTCTVK